MNRPRAELVAIILKGESVLLPDGRNITTLEELPSAIDLAGNDIILKQVALGNLQEAQAEIARQIAEAQASIKAGDAAPVVPAPYSLSAEVPPVVDPNAKTAK